MTLYIAPTETKSSKALYKSEKNSLQNQECWKYVQKKIV